MGSNQPVRTYVGIVKGLYCRLPSPPSYKYVLVATVDVLGGQSWHTTGKGLV